MTKKKKTVRLPKGVAKKKLRVGKKTRTVYRTKGGANKAKDKQGGKNTVRKISAGYVLDRK